MAKVMKENKNINWSSSNRVHPTHDIIKIKKSLKKQLKNKIKTTKKTKNLKTPKNRNSIK